jgi:hypothetical protein
MGDGVCGIGGTNGCKRYHSWVVCLVDHTGGRLMPITQEFVLMLLFGYFVLGPIVLIGFIGLAAWITRDKKQ